MAHEHILVIEDDEDIQELIVHNLRREGFRVMLAGSGEDSYKMMREDQFDCILLDIMLPGVDGLEVCRTIKSDPHTQNIPVIMVTAKGEESDIVTGLELGAEDYIVKPFSPRVMIARIRSILRRKATTHYDAAAVITAGKIEIHPGRHELLYKGEPVELTHSEFQILHLLVSRPGWVFTRNQIIDKIRTDNYPVTDRSVDVVIVGLRKKLGEAGEIIKTVRGIGYKCIEQD